MIYQLDYLVITMYRGDYKYEVDDIVEMQHKDVAIAAMPSKQIKKLHFFMM
jgi:hypothetical protein